MAEIKQTSLPGVFEIFPRVFPDNRGYFFESFRGDWLEQVGVQESWVQDNQSFSQKGTVRGIHFQCGEHAQAKLVRVISGKVLDVAVDLRKGSANFGQVYTTILDTEKNNLLYIPAGFGHGFPATPEQRTPNPPASPSSRGGRRRIYRSPARCSVQLYPCLVQRRSNVQHSRE